MRCIIAGGRDYKPVEEHYQEIVVFLSENGVTEVVSGCCRGADKFGEKIAKELGLPVKKFPADWKTYGKQAGYLRNLEMSKYADLCIVLPGGIGSNMMMHLAVKSGLKTFSFLSEVEV